jgi:hypothetical protein
MIDHSKGFYSGVRYSREQFITFLKDHNGFITTEEIIRELELWTVQDGQALWGLADGKIAPSGDSVNVPF